MQDKSGRRNFLKKASLGAALSVGIPSIVSAALASETKNKIVLNKEDVILFQGDSITDARRKRDEKEPNNSSGLGSGYAFMAAAKLLYQHAGKNLKIYNKGISGNKVYQLAERWDEDCISIRPTVLSILIGVNDFWHTLANNYTGTIKTYRDDLKSLLDKTKQQLPEVKLIIGEPFAVAGIKAVDEKWYPAFNDYRNAAKEIAADFKTVFIPYQAVFDKAQQIAPGAYWTYDGVHPSTAGSSLMAHAWLEMVK